MGKEKSTSPPHGKKVFTSQKRKEKGLRGKMRKKNIAITNGGDSERGGIGTLGDQKRVHSRRTGALKKRANRKGKMSLWKGAAHGPGLDFKAGGGEEYRTCSEEWRGPRGTWELSTLKGNVLKRKGSHEKRRQLRKSSKRSDTREGILLRIPHFQEKGKENQHGTSWTTLSAREVKKREERSGGRRGRGILHAEKI